MDLYHRSYSERREAENFTAGEPSRMNRKHTVWPALHLANWSGYAERRASRCALQLARPATGWEMARKTMTPTQSLFGAKLKIHCPCLSVGRVLRLVCIGAGSPPSGPGGEDVASSVQLSKAGYNLPGQFNAADLSPPSKHFRLSLKLKYRRPGIQVCTTVHVIPCFCSTVEYRWWCDSVFCPILICGSSRQ